MEGAWLLLPNIPGALELNMRMGPFRFRNPSLDEDYNRDGKKTDQARRSQGMPESRIPLTFASSAPPPPSCFAADRLEFA
jgi:hypothetical protein